MRSWKGPLDGSMQSLRCEEPALGGRLLQHKVAQLTYSARASSYMERTGLHGGRIVVVGMVVCPSWRDEVDDSGLPLVAEAEAEVKAKTLTTSPPP